MANRTDEYVALHYGEALCASTAVDTDFLMNNPHRAETFRDVEAGAMIQRLTVWVLSHEGKRVIYRTPRNWWQMFKRDCFPPWVLRWFPVDEVVEVVESKTLFPFPRIKFPDELGAPIRYVKVSREAE